MVFTTTPAPDIGQPPVDELQAERLAQSVQVEAAFVAAVQSRVVQPARFVVAFSGGLDSTVLLHLAAGQRSKTLAGDLLAIHVDHNISVTSAEWASHCEQIAQQWQVPFLCCQVPPGALAGGNLEHRAREIRYRLIAEQLGDNDLLMTAHHHRDQAETLLLQLFRGAGVRGTAAMAVESALSTGPAQQIRLLRPLLALSQQALEGYARHHQLQWVEDPSNQQQVQDRNFLRNKVMPVLRERWPALDNSLARSARLQAQSSELLDELAAQDMAKEQVSDGGLSRSRLRNLSVARRHNLLRFWLHQLRHTMPSEKQLQEMDRSVLQCRLDRLPRFTWGESVITCYQDRLKVERQQLEVTPEPMAEWLLTQTLEYPELGRQLIAVAADGGQGMRWSNQQRLEVRFRQGGETIVLNGHRRKLKKLLQQWAVPPAQRSRLPLIYGDQQLLAVPGYAIADSVRATSGEQGWYIHWLEQGS